MQNPKQIVRGVADRIAGARGAGRRMLGSAGRAGAALLLDAQVRLGRARRGVVPRALAVLIEQLGTGYRSPVEIARCDRALTDRGLHAVPERGTLAAAAAKVGDLELAARISEDALEAGLDSPTVAHLHARAVDRLRILSGGWPVAVPQVARYQPDPRSVLTVLSQSLPVRAGGYATRSHGLLTSLRDVGWDVEAVTRLGFPYDRWPADDQRQVPERDVVDGLGYRRLLEPGRRSYPQVPLADYAQRSADRIAAVAAERRAGLIHASSFYATGLPAADAAAALGVPFIYEMRGAEDLMRSVNHPPYPATSDGRFLIDAETQVCHRADHVLVITDALRQEMVARGVPADKMTVVPNGVHAADFQPEPRDEELARSLGLTGRVVIGYLGGFPRYEGLELLLRAFSEVASRREDVALLLVGDGQQEPALRALARRLGLGGRVVFTGRVPHADIPRYLSLVDITPFPRLPLPVCELISPMKPFEAMATGKAVVVSDVAALTQIVTDGVTGLTFAKGDAHALAATLEHLVADPALRSRLGAAARSWVSAHADWSQIAGAVDAVYRRLLNLP